MCGVVLPLIPAAERIHAVPAEIAAITQVAAIAT
jgi:hypothetical protein